MGEVQQAETQVNVGQGQLSKPKWGDEISDERKRKLEAYLTRWVSTPEGERGERRGPFHRQDLTGADVFWLAARTAAESEDRETEAEAIARAADVLRWSADNEFARAQFAIDLSQLHLEGAVLIHSDLGGADLEDAHLRRGELARRTP